MPSRKIPISKIKSRLKVYNLELVGNYIDTQHKTTFKCFCGNTFQSTVNTIFSNRMVSCKKCSKKRMSILNTINISGQRYNKLYVIKLIQYNNSKYLCRCDCGTEVIVSRKHLKSGATKSCGCLKRIKGKERWNYNRNLSDEDRQSRNMDAKNKIWSQSVLKRDNYTCQVCSTKRGPFNAHHLNAYKKYPLERIDINNGVCLCRKCHKNFHMKYGRGDNTKQQFEQYIWGLQG